MNTNDLNTALYEKMAAEQDKYRDWLKSQPPEEILHHTYEYTIREDIVMAMEELELIFILLHTRLSMEKQTHTGFLTRRIFPAKLPLSRRSVPIIGITGWILLLRCKRFWRNLEQSG